MGSRARMAALRRTEFAIGEAGGGGYAQGRNIYCNRAAVSARQTRSPRGGERAGRGGGRESSSGGRQPKRRSRAAIRMTVRSEDSRPLCVSMPIELTASWNRGRCQCGRVSSDGVGAADAFAPRGNSPGEASRTRAGSPGNGNGPRPGTLSSWMRARAIRCRQARNEKGVGSLNHRASQINRLGEFPCIVAPRVERLPTPCDYRSATTVHSRRLLASCRAATRPKPHPPIRCT